MEQNKVRSYLLYALGEILLVVVGILIALQVNNWNEQRKLNRERNELIQSLIIDFKATRERLAAKTADTEQYIRRTSRFLSLSYTNNEDVPVDSLQYDLAGAFEYPTFEPILATYNQAVSTGKIGLIEDTSFLGHMTEFLAAYNYYKQQTELSGEIFYNGSIWEIRKEVGNLVSLAGESRSRNGSREIVPEAYRLSEEEYRAFIRRPEVFAAIDNMQTIFYNVLISFDDMDSAARSVIRELEELK